MSIDWQYSHSTLPLAAACVIALVLAAMLWRRRRQEGALPLMALLLGAAVWSSGEAIELGCLDLTAKVWWAKYRHVGIATIPYAWLVFALLFSRNRAWVTRRTLAILALLPLVNLLVIWTNDWHGLIWAKIWLYPQGGMRYMASERGSWYWFYVGYAYVYVLVGTVLLVRTAIRSHATYRYQTLLVVSGILAPLLTNVVFQLRLSPVPYQDVTPLSFTFAAVVLTWSFFRHGFFFAPMPVARDQVLQSMKDGVVVLDLEQRILDLNHAAIEMLGKEERELIGHRVDEFLDLMAAREDSAMQGPSLIDVAPSSGHGLSRQLEATVSPLYKKWTGIVGSVVMLRDVTEQLELQDLLRQSQKMEAIGRLAGGIAHDFNNMLVPIIGYAELLLETIDAEDDRRDSVNEVLEAAKRAGRLTRQLMAFSRKQILELKPIDVNDVVRNFTTILRRTIREDILFDLRLESPLDGVWADVTQIEQVLMNLVLNARDAMPEEGVLTIETAEVDASKIHPCGGAALNPGRYVMLAVSDTGAGIPADIQEHLFEPFFTTRADEGGTGLGLATVHGIVQQHNGAVSVTSQPNEGTTVAVYLPVRMAGRDSDNVEPPAAATDEVAKEHAHTAENKER